LNILIEIGKLDEGEAAQKHTAISLKHISASDYIGFSPPLDLPTVTQSCCYVGVEKIFSGYTRLN